MHLDAGAVHQRNTNDRSLESRVAVVTGSTSGIGLGIARALAQAGAHVMLNGLGDKLHVEKLCRGMESEFHSSVRFSSANISKPAEVARLVAEAKNEFGKIDILVNNAGIQHTASIEDFPPERWDSILAINLTSNFHSIRLVLPEMKHRNWGRIINVASVHGIVASTRKSAYVAAKHGVLGLTKVVALETARTGITCNAICPGWVLTPLVQKQIEDTAGSEQVSIEQARHDLLFEKQPSGEFATVDQIGALTVFLCSENAEQIRGATITIDGGWSAQ